VSLADACQRAFEKWATRADATGRPVVATLDRAYRPFVVAAAQAAAVHRFEISEGPLGFAVRIPPRVVN
jgi:hypothetical protein